MPRKPKSAADRLLEQQVADLIKNIKSNDEPKIDVARALALFDKAAKYQEQALAILRGEEVENEPAPGKNRVGRPKKGVPGSDGELFQGNMQATGEADAEKSARNSKKKKGATVEAENA